MQIEDKLGFFSVLHLRILLVQVEYAKRKLFLVILKDAYGQPAAGRSA